MDQNFCSVSVLESNFFHLIDFCFDFQHCVRTWVKMFTTHKFPMKKVLLENQDFFGKLAFKEQFSWSIYTVKTSMLAFLCILEKLMRKKLFSFKKKKLDQTFWKKSVFESFFVQRVMFWIKIFKRVRLRAIFLQLDNFE